MIDPMKFKTAEEVMDADLTIDEMDAVVEARPDLFDSEREYADVDDYITDEDIANHYARGRKYSDMLYGQS